MPIVTLQLLVNIPDDKVLVDYLHGMLRPQQQAFQERRGESKALIIDYKLTNASNELCCTELPQQIDDAIRAGTYRPGDAFKGRNGAMQLSSTSFDLGAASCWFDAAKDPSYPNEGLSLYVSRRIDGLNVEIYPLSAPDVDPDPLEQYFFEWPSLTA